MPPLKDDIKSIEDWLENLDDESFPAEIRAVIERLILRTNITVEEINKSKTKQSALAARLREAMGILPKAESPPKSSSTASAGTGDAAKPSKLERYDRFKKNRKLTRKSLAKGKRKKARVKGNKDNPSEQDSDTRAPLADPELASIAENLSSPLPIGTVTRHKQYKIDPTLLPKGKVKRWFDKRQRWYIDIKMVREVILVEHAEIDGTVISAKMPDLGPEGTLLSWRLLTTFILALVVGHIPINRLASLLSGASRYLSASNISRWIITTVADYLVEIYFAVAAELADASSINLDDSPIRILDIQRELQGLVLERKEHPKYENLVRQVTEEFGRRFETADGKSLKKSVNLSVLIGRGIRGNFHHSVVFYRSHIGSAGNLLSVLLKMRSPKAGPLSLQSDLLSANFPKGEATRKFQITYFGCLPHGRRPFWRYRTQDPALCDLMLKGFGILAWVESRIDDIGRTKENTIKLRRRHARKVLAYLYRVAQSVIAGKPMVGRRWPPDDPLSQACKYIVKNYKKLTAYIEDPRIGPDNNLSERLLRGDKTYQKAAGFTATEHGRIALDVLRTLVATARACKVSPYRYFIWVFRNRDLVADTPEKFTPYCYKLRTQRQDLQQKAA